MKYYTSACGQWTYLRFRKYHTGLLIWNESLNLLFALLLISTVINITKKVKDFNGMKFLCYPFKYIISYIISYIVSYHIVSYNISFPKSHCLPAASTFFPFVSLVRPTCRQRRLQSIGRMIVTEKPEVLLFSPQI